ncbi:hypothetical protein D6C85_09537 [Aureobasidium pullulans]|uniref:Uncharacterized protein n=1 Tax=Aureobasidium pullulans TaxID=5580 RepID=A0A4S9W941_AURPU|nr:hypothetical protein D6C85_09537 [Aureobasidium pullulans]
MITSLDEKTRTVEQNQHFPTLIAIQHIAISGPVERRLYQPVIRIHRTTEEKLRCRDPCVQRSNNTIPREENYTQTARFIMRCDKLLNSIDEILCHSPSLPFINLTNLNSKPVSLVKNLQ